jgi:hypothetical protein
VRRNRVDRCRIKPLPGRPRSKRHPVDEQGEMDDTELMLFSRSLGSVWFAIRHMRTN